MLCTLPDTLCCWGRGHCRTSQATNGQARQDVCKHWRIRSILEESSPSIVVLPLPLGPICNIYIARDQILERGPSTACIQTFLLSSYGCSSRSLAVLSYGNATHQRGKLSRTKVPRHLQKKSEVLLAIVIVSHSICQVLRAFTETIQWASGPTVAGLKKRCSSCLCASRCSLAPLSRDWGIMLSVHFKTCAHDCTQPASKGAENTLHKQLCYIPHQKHIDEVPRWVH